MVDILREPVTGRSVWTAADIGAEDSYARRFTEDDLQEFDRALAGVREKSAPELSKRDFPLPSFSAKVRDVLDELEHGTGFVLLRGLPIHDRYSVEEAAKIYWAIGLHLGELVPQNRRGELIGHIRNLGAKGHNTRGYATASAAAFHTDQTDIVGLMCLRPARSGGISLVASAMALYNIVLDEHPEWLDVLYKRFPTDWVSEEPPGSPGWYYSRLYSYVDGLLSAAYRTGRILSATRFPDVPRLGAREVACLLFLDEIPTRPGVALDMTLEVGDIQFVNNFVTLHSRTGFVDDPDDPAFQRHLLRLWVSRPDTGRVVCPEYHYWRSGISRLEWARSA
ncbi:TauD/TfdA family dioxygenase [Actinomadura sp. 3N508]|uniref:TauD/TfdA family dioxygenase n=1 Tax=Actinomadura sp. 3N508 TaxID=3375153 RepID=UPI00379B73BF